MADGPRSAPKVIGIVLTLVLVPLAPVLLFVFRLPETRKLVYATPVFLIVALGAIVGARRLMQRRLQGRMGHINFDTEAWVCPACETPNAAGTGAVCGRCRVSAITGR